MENVMNQIPENIMKPHDPNDDPFAALSDDSSNQLQSPLEFGSGVSYFVQPDDKGNGSSAAGTTKQDGSPSAAAAATAAKTGTAGGTLGDTPQETKGEANTNAAEGSGENENKGSA